MILWFLIAVVLHIYNLSWLWWIAWLFVGGTKATLWWYETWSKLRSERRADAPLIMYYEPPTFPGHEVRS